MSVVQQLIKHGADGRGIAQQFAQSSPRRLEVTRVLPTSLMDQAAITALGYCLYTRRVC